MRLCANVFTEARLSPVPTIAAVIVCLCVFGQRGTPDRASPTFDAMPAKAPAQKCLNMTAGVIEAGQCVVVAFLLSPRSRDEIGASVRLSQVLLAP